MPRRYPASVAAAGAYTMSRLAADLAEVLTALEVAAPLTLVGHSMGGMTALQYLGLHAPARPVTPEGLVLAGAAAGKLCTRGLGRLLGTPATDALAALGEHTTAFNALGTLGR